MKTLQIVCELVDVPEWGTAAEAEPISVQFNQYTHDTAPAATNPTLLVLAMQQLKALAVQRGRPIHVGDAIRVLIYDLKERRPLLKPHITTWIVKSCECCVVQQVSRVAHLRPSMN